jgi:NTE family protein
MTTLHDWLDRRPFTLALSGGFFGFFAHTGLLAALEAVGLRPRRIVGVSSGALAGGTWASGLPAVEMEAELLRLRRADFWDPGVPLGGLLTGKRFEAKLAGLLTRVGVWRIEECRVPFIAVTYDLIRRRCRTLTRGPLARAIRASCAVPLLFRPVLWRGSLLVDGGLGDRTGFCALASGERVLYHHLASSRQGARQLRVLPGHGRPGCQVVAVSDLPRVSPLHLDRGRHALRRVREEVLRRLEEPLPQIVPGTRRSS